MAAGMGLEDYLTAAGTRDSRIEDAAAAIGAIASCGRVLGGLLADATPTNPSHVQTLMADALRDTPVASILFNDAERPVMLDPARPLCLAIDTPAEASDVAGSVPMGLIISVTSADAGDPTAGFFAPGRLQIAAGLMVFGLNTTLVLTLGTGTQAFTLDREGCFIATGGAIRIPQQTGEYAINGSNQRHWHPAIRNYVGDCQDGADGPRGRDFDTRWLASLVGEAYRILVRGGVYLNPADERQGHREGRMRLACQANPIAFLVEQAGGEAIDGHARILDIEPKSLQQCTGLIFGSSEEIAEIGRYYSRPAPEAASPLFTPRSLFRV